MTDQWLGCYDSMAATGVEKTEEDEDEAKLEDARGKGVTVPQAATLPRQFAVGL